MQITNVSSLTTRKRALMAARLAGGRLWAIILAILAMGPGMLRAGSIAVPNGSFESPETGFADPRVDSWQKTPKPVWYDESGGNLWDQLTGVFRNTAAGSADYIDNCDGNQALFLFALPQVGFFQDFDSVDGTNSIPSHAFDVRFKAGSSYRLTVGAMGGGGGMLSGASMEASLYYRDASSNRVTVAATSITNTVEAFPDRTHFVDFYVDVPVVKESDAWAGRNMGVMLVSTVAPNLIGGYWDLDNIRLSSTEIALTVACERSGADLKISWPSISGQQYQVQASGNLASWPPYEAPLLGNGGELFKLIPAHGNTNAFFRVLSTPGQ